MIKPSTFILGLGIATYVLGLTGVIKSSEDERAKMTKIERIVEGTRLPIMSLGLIGLGYAVRRNKEYDYWNK